MIDTAMALRRRSELCKFMHRHCIPYFLTYDKGIPVLPL